MTLSIKCLHVTLNINDTQHNNNDQHIYAECLNLFIIMLSDDILNVIMRNVIILNIVIQNVVAPTKVDIWKEHTLISIQCIH